jgi:hypothetical protein
MRCRAAAVWRWLIRIELKGLYFQYPSYLQTMDTPKFAPGLLRLGQLTGTAATKLFRQSADPH